MEQGSDISHQIGSLSGKLDLILEHQRQAAAHLDKIETRVRALEAHRGYLLGIVASAAVVWGLLFEWIKTTLAAK